MLFLSQRRFRAGWLRFFARVVFDFRGRFDAERLCFFVRVFPARFDFTLRFRLAFALGCNRSGNSAFPAARFHSSKVSGEILPSTNNWANFLRCALLLIGIEISRHYWPRPICCMKVTRSYMRFSSTICPLSQRATV
jgi:hypothetical protein